MSGTGLICLLIVGLPIWFFVLLIRTARKEPSVPWGAHLRKLAPEWCLCLGLMLFIALLLPAITPSGKAARRMQCQNNLKQIGLALHNYHDAHGCYPPAYTTDKHGQRLHSWRVLLLPYLEQEDLYDELRLDEPWGSEHNLSVMARMCSSAPDVYRCPGDVNDKVTDTTYVMLVGPGTISDGGSCTSRDDVTDGEENTIVVAEMSESGIHWMEPRDLHVDEMSFRINNPDAPAVRSEHPGVANVLFADGHIRSLEEEIAPRDLKALTTIAGDEHNDECKAASGNAPH